jgi:hypothetical protein
MVGDIHKFTMDLALGRKARIDRGELLRFGRVMRSLVRKYS